MWQFQHVEVFFCSLPFNNKRKLIYEEWRESGGRQKSLWIVCSHPRSNEKLNGNTSLLHQTRWKPWRWRGWFCNCYPQNWTTWLDSELNFGWITWRLTCTRFTYMNTCWKGSIYCLAHRVVSQGKSNHQKTLPLQYHTAIAFSQGLC